MTIKERAKAHADKYYTEDTEDEYLMGRADGRELGYIQGAKDQMEIDIEKALDWLNNHTDWDATWNTEVLEDAFRKAMTQ